MRRSIQLAAAALFVMSVSSVHAFPINIANSGATLAGSDLTELQSILNNLYAGAGHTPDALANQIHDGTFSLPTGAAAEFTLRYQDTYLSNNTFGIFSAAPGAGGLDATTLQTLRLFQGSPSTVNPYGQASPQISWTVAFDSKTGKVTTAAINSADCGVLVNCGTFQPSQPITSSLFGFYANRPTNRPTGGGDYGTDGYMGNFWTINQLNNENGAGAGFPQALIYKETISGNQDRWTIALDDIHTTNPDFNDFVMTMDVYRDGVIPAVPEPGALLLFGTALLGSVSMLRRMARR